MLSPSLAIILTIAAVIGSPIGGYVLLIARRDKPAEDAGNEIADAKVVGGGLRHGFRPFGIEPAKKQSRRSARQSSPKKTPVHSEANK